MNKGDKVVTLVAVAYLTIGALASFMYSYVKYIPCYTAVQIWDEEDHIIDQLIEKMGTGEAQSGFKTISTEDDLSDLLNRGADLAKEIRIHADQCLGTHGGK